LKNFIFEQISYRSVDPPTISEKLMITKSKSEQQVLLPRKVPRRPFASISRSDPKEFAKI
jgi:hypothetical protein